MTAYQVVGIGNAIVDVIAECDERFLSENGIEKGVMQLIGAARAEELYDRMGPRMQMPGGSVANTMAGLGALGLSTAFIGRVRDDALGHDYVNAMRAAGTDFVTLPMAGDLPTSRSMIFVSPDGERSMNTYLGISTELGPGDVDNGIAGAAKLLFLEGYLYDKPKGKAAFERGARACRAGGGRAGITLSDPFCVERHRDDFRALLGQLDYVFGNEQEWRALFQTEDLDAALSQAAAECPLVICTRSGKEVLIHGEGHRIEVPVTEVIPVDATGAGDQFAAGFLYGIVTGRSLALAGRMGCIAAAEVIGHRGARPEGDVAMLFRAEGLL